MENFFLLLSPLQENAHEIGVRQASNVINSSHDIDYILFLKTIKKKGLIYWTIHAETGMT